MKLLAEDIKIAPSGGLRGPGTNALSVVTDNGFITFSNIISMAIGIMTVVAIVWFMFVLITGAIGIIGSGGDKQALENAKKRITSGLIGLVIVIVAVFIIDLIGYIFGIEFLNLYSMLTKISVFQQ